MPTYRYHCIDVTEDLHRYRVRTARFQGAAGQPEWSPSWLSVLGPDVDPSWKGQEITLTVGTPDPPTTSGSSFPETVSDVLADPRNSVPD